MKKIRVNIITPQLVSFVILSLSIVAFFTSCQKTGSQPAPASAQERSRPFIQVDENKNVEETPPRTRTVGTIAYNEGRQLGVFDWYIKLYRGQWEVLANLPETYRKNGLVVDVTYVPTNERIKTVQGPKYMMKVIEIIPVKTKVTLLSLSK